MTDPELLLTQPVVPAPTALPLNVAALLRVLLTSIGGGLVQHGAVTESAWSLDSGIIMLVAAIVWLLVQNNSYVKALVAALAADSVTLVNKSGDIVVPPTEGHTP